MYQFNTVWDWKKEKKKIRRFLGGLPGGNILLGAMAEVGPKADTAKKFRETFLGGFRHLRYELDLDLLAQMRKNQLTLLNHTEQIDLQNWNREYHSPLWNHHLHCFEYALWAARAFVELHDPRPMKSCQHMIEWWIKRPPRPWGGAWKRLPLAIRIVNWIYGYALVENHYDDQVFLARWRASALQQFDRLSRRVRLRPQGSDLVKVLKALVLGGLFFDRREDLPEWESMLWRQFEAQILEDGGHWERSPMIHAQVLGDLLECYALLVEFRRFPPSGGVVRTLHSMARYLDVVQFPEGNLPLFNDSAPTDSTWAPYVVESARLICDYKPAEKTEEKSGNFPYTGYHAWQSSDSREKIVVDAGLPAAHSLGAHAHCDLLSYELYLCGRQFIVDSGVHGYEGDPFREYCRSTRAHNTVQFDGVEQSIIRGASGAGPKAYGIGVSSDGNQKQGEFTFTGQFKRYDGKLTHRRHITRRYNNEIKSFEWMIEDIALTGRMKLASSFIHLHPSWNARVLPKKEFNKREVVCECGSSRVLIEAFAEERDPDPEEDVEVEILSGVSAPIQGWFFADFGVYEQNPTIRFDFAVSRGDKFGYRIRVLR